MPEALPKALGSCPGNRVNANLVDRARKIGIAVWLVDWPSGVRNGSTGQWGDP